MNTVSKSETQSRKTKLVNLNRTQDQPRNRPLARPGQQEAQLMLTNPRDAFRVSQGHQT